MALSLNGTSGISGIDGSAGTPALQGSDTNTGISFGTDEVNINTGGTTRATVDSSGRVLVGTSSTSEPTTALLQGNSSIGTTGAGILKLARGEAAPADGNAIGEVRFTDSGHTSAATFLCLRDGGTWSASSKPTRLVLSTTSDGASSPTERMRITQAGFLKVSNSGSYISSTDSDHQFKNSIDNNVTARFDHTGTSGTQYGLFVKLANDQNDTTRYFLQCDGGATTRFVLRSNGGLANYSANNANLSDRNAKKDITPAAGTWDCIKEWEIVNYRYNDQPDDADLNLGVIAQQVAESCPEVITVFQEAKEATEDQPAQEERLGVKEQQMYWMAIKALQEAQVRIEALEAEVAALKAQ